MIEERLLDTGIHLIAGVDEAGRGACAGPLVVAAVMIKDLRSAALSEVRDSKKLTPKTRERLFDVIIKSAAAYSIITINSDEIDSQGLQKCNIEGMRRAVLALDPCPEYVLSDGYPVDGLAIPNLAIWKGDQVALTISAASILAKVARDRIMEGYEIAYPGYGFEGHKGYGTSTHHDAIAKLGITPIHRISFANVAALINK